MQNVATVSEAIVCLDKLIQLSRKLAKGSDALGAGLLQLFGLHPGSWPL